MASPSDPSRASFTRLLPKIELHAHLNGSIRRTTLLSLAAARSVDASAAVILSRWPSTLSDAFDVFRVIHLCVTTLADVERIAYELGQDLEEDGVVYAEIRSTPRAMDASGWDGYVDAVLKGFERYAAEGGTTVLRLLLSVDRAKHGADEAEAVVDLALSHPAVVGIDLSGDPTKGHFATFLPALTRARSAGLHVTLHAAEVSNHAEMSAMLDFHPNRFGHCCFVNSPNLLRLRASRIPIELCLTSNLLSNSVASLKDHHFALHYAAAKGSICCISTDDSGVFGSPLSNEYRLAMETFGLGERETFALARRVLEATFLEKGGEVWKGIETKFDAFEEMWDWQE